jgi:GNAT superfamily N-acetyltransferase
MGTSDIHFIRTDSGHPDFRELVAALDAELRERDGEEHTFYQAFNGIDALDRCVVGYLAGKPVCCGALKGFDPVTLEVKRMYTRPEARGLGMAGRVLQHLETWAAESGFSRCVLETGRRQPEAIRLYTRHGFRQIDNYGPYAGVANSLCFEKYLRALKNR